MDTPLKTEKRENNSSESANEELQIYSFSEQKSITQPLFKEVVLDEAYHEKEVEELYPEEETPNFDEGAFAQRVVQSSGRSIEKRFNNYIDRFFSFPLYVNSSVVVRSSRTIQRLKKYVETIEQFKQYGYPLSDQSLINHLKWYLINQDTKQALRLGKEYCLRYPNSAQLHYLHALALYRKEQWDMARLEAEKASALDSVDGSAGYLRGMCHYKNGNLEAAAGEFKLVFSFFEQEPVFLRFVLPLFAKVQFNDMRFLTLSALVRLSPEKFALRKELAHFCYEQEEYARAIFYLESVCNEQDGIEKYKIAVCSAYLGRLKSAQNGFAELLGDSSGIEYGDLLQLIQQRYPEDDKLSGLVAIHYYDNGLIDNAISFCESLGKRRFENRIALILARCYLSKERIKDAVQLLAKTKISHNVLEPLFSLLQGLALFYSGDYEKASLQFKKAVASETEKGECCFFLGEIAFKEERFEEAVSYFDVAIRKEYRPLESLVRLGYAALKGGLLLVSEAAFKKVIKIDSNCAEAYNNLGIIAVKRGRYDEAAANLKRAIDLDPDNKDAHYNLSVVYEKVLADRARTHLETFVALENRDGGDET